MHQFCDHFRSFITEELTTEKVDRFLLIRDGLTIEKNNTPEWLSENQTQAWLEFLLRIKKCYIRDQEKFPQKASFYYPKIELDFELDKEKRDCSEQLVKSLDIYTLIVRDLDTDLSASTLLFLLFQANKWHIKQGGFFIHSSGVSKGLDGFLFLGESNAGKTTVVELSAKLGYPVLGDDINLLSRAISDNGSYHITSSPSPVVSPFGYSSSQPRLRGIFSLKQDDKDYLISLTRMQTAVALHKGIRQIPKTKFLSNEEIAAAFNTCCTIARSVPGYELHFRKSPDFWKLIDAEFPD